MDDLRAACAQVASTAQRVQIRIEAVDAYAGSLPLAAPATAGPLRAAAVRLGP